MDSLNEHLCLFCATQCSPKFILQCDGKLTKLKTEGNSNGMFLSGDVNSEELVIEEDLKAVFIVGKLLNIPCTDWSEFLGKHDGQYRPGLWFPVCDLCDNLVHQCYQCYREIAKLEKALENGKIKLKRHILESTTEADLKFPDRTRAHEGLSVWKSIRSQVNAGFCIFQTADEYLKDGDKESDALSTPDEDINTSAPASPDIPIEKGKQFKRKITKATNSTRSRTGKRKNLAKITPKSKRHQPDWSVITVADEELQNDWRIRSAHHLASSKLVTYYCYHGGRTCGARLKKRVSYNSNEVVIESNNVEHSNHGEKQTITEEQKQFILESFNKNIAKPRYILSNFQKTGVASPSKIQLRNYLAYCRRTNVIPRTSLPLKFATHLKRTKLRLQSKKRESISSLKRHNSISIDYQKTPIKANDEEIKSTLDSPLNKNTANDLLPDENSQIPCKHDETQRRETPRRGRGRPRGKTVKKPAVITLVKTNRQNWTVIPTLTDDELQNNWSIRGSVTHSDCKLQIFYCWFGRRKCGARLKKRIFHTSGEVIMEKNDIEHSNHREKPALTLQQKQLILDSLSDNIYQPKDILSVFEQKTIPSPRKDQVKSFLARQRKLDLVRNSRLGGMLYLSAKEHCTGPEDNPFVCQYCDQRFKTIMSLEVHQSENHQEVLEITPIICELCGLSTGSTRYFEYHKKSNCLGSAKAAFKYVCKLCGKGFNDKKGLMAHMKGIMHKDADEDSPSHFQFIDGAYSCNYCGERFIRGIKIVTHMKAVHEDKTKTEFRCEGCLLVFDKLRLLLNHRKICECLGGDGGEARKAAKIKKAEEAKGAVKVVRCKQCKMEFNSYKICFTHKKKAHPELFSKHMCDACGTRFMTEYRLTKHKKLCVDEVEEAEANPGPSGGQDY